MTQTQPQKVIPMHIDIVETGGNLLTEVELYLHSIHMTVVKSANIGSGTSYAPVDEFSRGARELLEDLDQPEAERHQLVSNLRDLVETFQLLGRDFSELNRYSDDHGGA